LWRTGKLVSLQDSLDGCERILRDEFKDYPEGTLYMIGAIDEARTKAKTGRSVVQSGPQPAPKPDPEVHHAATDPHES
jgi:F-type H+-transporting ATPase subunit beta